MRAKDSKRPTETVVRVRSHLVCDTVKLNDSIFESNHPTSIVGIRKFRISTVDVCHFCYRTFHVSDGRPRAHTIGAVTNLPAY